MSKARISARMIGSAVFFIEAIVVYSIIFSYTIRISDFYILLLLIQKIEKSNVFIEHITGELDD